MAEAEIKQFYTDSSKTTPVYPVTVPGAIIDQNGCSCPVYSDEVETTSAGLRDADTLGGKYKATDIDNIKTNLGNIMGFGYTRQNVSITVEGGAFGKTTYIDVDVPTGYETYIPIAVNTGNASLAIQATCSNFGATKRIGLFNSHTNSVTINTTFVILWLKVQ